jgi:hypothetical protein
MRPSRWSDSGLECVCGLVPLVKTQHRSLAAHVFISRGRPQGGYPARITWNGSDYLAFQLAMVIPMIAKSIRPDNPNSEKEIFSLIWLGNAPPSPRTRKLIPRVIISHCPICSIILDDCFRFGVERTSLIGLRPNNRKICLLNIPIKTVTIPTINQKGNMVSFPFVLVHPPGSYPARITAYRQPGTKTMKIV